MSKPKERTKQTRAKKLAANQENSKSTSPHDASLTRYNAAKYVRKRGRKSLLTPELQKELCKLLADAHTISTVCEYVGISERVYFEWCEQNPHFLQATARARARAKVKLVESILKSKDWRAQAWHLERCYPAEFGRTGERPVPQQESKEIEVEIIYNNTKPMSELLDFPIAPGTNI